MRRALALSLIALAACSDDSQAGDGGAQDGGQDGRTLDGDAALLDAADAGLPKLPFGVNALVLPSASATDAPIALYPVASPKGSLRAIAFTYDGTTLEALDQDAGSLWKKSVGAGALFGGFDIDGDGVVDLGLVRAKELTTLCYGKPLHERTIDVVRGSDGTVFPGVVAPLTDICWNFGYATEQWSVLAALFGGQSRDLVLVPQYTSTNANALNPYEVGKAFVVGLEGTGFVARGEMIMPTIPAYDAFPASKPEAHGSGTHYYAASHVPNGLVTGVGPSAKLTFFTSGRAVQYAMKTPFELTADRPWLTANRTDLVGRNYGLVMPDPTKPERIALVTGATTWAFWDDMRTGKMAADPYAGIERHVAIYDAVANTVDDRFFSYAHDGNDAFLYEGRTTHPNGVWLQDKTAGASRLVFDVYQNGHWHALVTAPGSTTTAFDARDLFVWDVRDLDGDGTPELVASPTRDPSDPDVPGYYFSKWRTVLYHWDEAAKALVAYKTIADAIPWLSPAFRDGTRSSSGGFLYPALTVDSGGKPALVVRRSDGTRRSVPVP